VSFKVKMEVANSPYLLAIKCACASFEELLAPWTLWMCLSISCWNLEARARKSKAWFNFFLWLARSFSAASNYLGHKVSWSWLRKLSRQGTLRCCITF